MTKILVEGSGGPAGIGFCRSLKNKNFWILGTDTNPYYLVRSETDKQILLDKVNDTHYIKNLNLLIDKFKIDFLHAQPDPVVNLISKYRKKLNCNIFLPHHKTIEICQNKFLSYKKWESSGLKTPTTYLIENPKQLKKFFKLLGGDIWIREIIGAAGKNSLPTNNFEIAKKWFEFHDGWGKFTIAKKLSPESVTWSSIWKDGELIVAQGRKRLYWEFSNRAMSGITGLTGGAITFSDKKIDEISIKAIHSIDKNPNGIFSVDLTYDEHKEPNLTEINIGRFFTTIEFFTQAGLNMPLIYTALGNDMKIPPIKRVLNPLPNNLCWIRGIDTLPILLPLKQLDKIKKNSLNFLI